MSCPKRDKTTKKKSKKQKNVKKIDDDVISENCDVIAIFPIYA